MKHARLTDVAKLAEVSLSTVSRAMNHSGYVADDVLKRIEHAAAELNYVHPSHKLSRGSDKRIGIISLYGNLSPYFPRLVQQLQETFVAYGYYGIHVAAAVLDNEALIFHVQQLMQTGVSGLIICGFNADTLADEARAVLQRYGVPIVFLERAAGCHGFNRVLVDNALGTYSAAKHLLDLGHKSLAYITLDKKASEVESTRVRGFMRAAEEAGVDSANLHVLSCSESTPIAAAEVLRSALMSDPSISGVVAWSDIYAAGALSCFESMGKHVPDEVEIIGYDNVLAPFLPTPLSSIEMPIEEIAIAATEIIDKHHQTQGAIAPRTITLEPRLIVVERR